MVTKALFLDLDGTLLNDSKEITSKNRTAIRSALASGHRVIISTGRPLVSAIKQAVRLGLTEDGCYLAAFNGGILYDMGSGEKIYERTVPMETVYPVFREADRRKLHIQTYDDNFVIVERHNDNAYVKRYSDTILMEHTVIDDISTLSAPPVKMLSIDFDDRAALESFAEWIRERFQGILDCFFSCPYYVEIVPSGLNKGTALVKLSEILGIPIENTIAAGDEANDIEMIRSAGIGVAMKNGTDRTKEAADYITENDNNNDGIAEIIEKFML